MFQLILILGILLLGQSTAAARWGVATASQLGLPALRPPGLTHPLPPPIPVALRTETADPVIGALRAAMASEVPGQPRIPSKRWAAMVAHAQSMLTASGTILDSRQTVLIADRNPARQILALAVVTPPAGKADWSLIGAGHISTGQAGRKDYYITPIGVFAHTDAILDFRAAGTYNEHHVRGLGLAGLRVWDFGWQWALKGWHSDGEGGDIRLQMHATDPKLLEPRLGRPASEGCVRVSTAMNKFLDRHGILDADYERVAATDPRYAALLPAGRDPTQAAGRLLIVIDTSLPVDAPPTSFSRPVDWPAPPDLHAPAASPQE